MRVLIIGAGVVGLAIAREAALRGHDVVIAETATAIGTGTSSRNSEVVHGGMYYPSGSRRARHCTLGRRLLYEYCASHGVPHRKCGKLIVATSVSEITKIEMIQAQGIVNGVEQLALIDRTEARVLEPALNCIAAVHSPETGIVDSHRLMLALRGDLEDHGGMIAFRTAVEHLVPTQSGWSVTFGGAESGTIVTDAIINAAGHGAQAIARATEVYPSERVPKLVLAKGSYFSFAGKPAFSRLIYPAPVDGGLGIHVTLDLAGRMRFGPDVEWVECENYDVNPGRAAIFYERIRSYWPGLPDASLVPDYAGIRPKLTGPGEPASDFLIDTPLEHGIPNLVHLFGIESPGLTSALSIAKEVLQSIVSS